MNLSLRLFGSLGLAVSCFRRAHASVFRRENAVPRCLKATKAGIFKGLTTVGGRNFSFTTSFGGGVNGS